MCQRGARSLLGGDLVLDDINDRRIRECAKITELIALTRDDFTHDTTHDLQNTGGAQ